MQERRLDMTGAMARATAFWTCETLFFLRDALGSAPVLNPSGLRVAVEGLGDRYVSVGTFGVRFGPDRYDGVRAVRPVTFDVGCGCFRYTGEPYDVG